jgi:hypothetical protein
MLRPAGSRLPDIPIALCLPHGVLGSVLRLADGDGRNHREVHFDGRLVAMVQSSWDCMLRCTHYLRIPTD